MFSQSEALAAVTIVTRCSYHTVLTPLMLSQSERIELGPTLFSQEAIFHVDLSLSISLKAEGTEAFPSTFNGLLFNYPVLIHFYSSGSASEILIHFTEVISVLLALSATLHSVGHYVYPLRDDWYLNMNVAQSGLFLNVSLANALMCVHV